MTQQNKQGMNALNGSPIDGVEHLRQSIRDILTTPLGSRVMRPDYGSNIPRLIDEPVHPSNFVEIYSAVAVALRKWEPRYKLTRIQVVEASPGKTVIDLEGQYLLNGQPLKLEGVRL